jgi:hypothetical protein
MQVIEPSSESIQNLVIDKDELNTIRALSDRQSSKIDSWSADFIAGKGSGQIILLHGINSLSTVVKDTSKSNFASGPPGVGKTYTVGMWNIGFKL